MDVTNDSFHKVGKTHENNDILKGRQNGYANAEAQFLKISGGMPEPGSSLLSNSSTVLSALGTAN
jgi:dihydropteroate synthase